MEKLKTNTEISREIDRIIEEEGDKLVEFIKTDFERSLRAGEYDMPIDDNKTIIKEFLRNIFSLKAHIQNIIKWIKTYNKNEPKKEKIKKIY